MGSSDAISSTGLSGCPFPAPTGGGAATIGEPASASKRLFAGSRASRLGSSVHGTTAAKAREGIRPPWPTPETRR